MLVIIDYNVGNLGSILNMIKRIGGDAVISSSLKDINNASKLILPGVGAFDYGISQLENLGLIDLLHKKVIQDKTPILGICLGMQLMTNCSEEGKKDGLWWIDAEVKKFTFASDNVKIPHMGWNYVKPIHYGSLYKGLENTAPRFYFVHSYYVSCSQSKDILSTTKYHDLEFVSAFQKEHIYGVQFHPEKSHKFGMQLLKNFIF